MEPWRQLAKRILEENDRRRMLDHLVDEAVEMSGAERGMLLLKDSRTHKLQIESARNLDRESLKGREARLSFHVAQQTVDGEATLLLDDAAGHQGFGGLNSVYELGLRSVLCVPIWSIGTVVGAIYVDSRFIPEAFGEKEARKLEGLADFTALFLGKDRLKTEVESLEVAVSRLTRKLEKIQQQLDEFQRITHRGARTGDAPDPKANRFPPIIGESEPMVKMYNIIQKVLDNDITVLIQGESGTGKELVAKAIHEYGCRMDKPFVAINCSSIPATLIESELFGHTKGAYTGASRDKKGLFEVAHTGTLFLDEVGDMPLEMQGKLLRTLQYGEIQPLGSSETRRVDVRLLAASNKPLDDLVKKGHFREDLFYRLNIVAISIPPLRKRREDIPLLVDKFVLDNREQGISEVEGVTPPALLKLSQYPWPGNVRELEASLKSACLFAEHKLLDASDFEVLQRSREGSADAGDHLFWEGKTLAAIERDVILAALESNDGNKKRTAEHLNIDRRTLYNKLKLYGKM